MKKIILIFLCIHNTIAFGQISIIKNNAKELLFNLTLSPKKFDVRTLFHTKENFIDFEEKSDFGIDKEYIISSNFIENFKLSYISSANGKFITYYFRAGAEKSHCTKIGMYYPSTKLNECLKQVDELMSIFSICSYKHTVADIGHDGEKTGETRYVYSSQLAYSKRSLTFTPYLEISYRYFAQSDRYYFEIYVYPENIY